MSSPWLITHPKLIIYSEQKCASFKWTPSIMLVVSGHCPLIFDVNYLCLSNQSLYYVILLSMAASFLEVK